MLILLLSLFYKYIQQACLGEGRERVKGKRLVVIVREAVTKREEIVGCSTKME